MNTGLNQTKTGTDRSSTISLILILTFCFFSSMVQAQTGTISGRIIDKVTNAPIPFANVVVEDTPLGSTTNMDGIFVITSVPAGYIQLVSTYVGYKPGRSSDIFVSPEKEVSVELTMEPTENQLDEVVIKADLFQKRIESPVSMQTIGIREIETNPGSNRDISRVIQSFPGVGSTPNFRNDIIVRGGGPSESRFFLDGVEIPVLNHFATQGASGGPVGIINADFISQVEYYSGAFPASDYNALSGVFEFTQKDGNSNHLFGQVALGASEASLTLEGPVGSKTTYLFSVRRSYLQFLFSAIGLPFLPTYNDYQFKTKIRFNTRNELTIISLGSLDKLKLNTGIKNPDASQEFILTELPVNNQWSYTIGAVYKHFMKNGYQQLVVSRNKLNNQFEKYPENNESLPKTFDYKSNETENKFRYEYHLKMHGIKYSYGISGEYASYDNRTYQSVYLNDSLTEINYQTNINLFKYGAYGQVSRPFLKERLNLSLGIRVDANTFSSTMNNPFDQLSPRFSVSYLLMDGFTLNANVGRYYQLPAYTTLGYANNMDELVNKNATYIGVNHYIAGFEHLVNEHIMWSAEGFFKDYFNYPIDLNTGASVANTGAEYSSVAGAIPVKSIGKGQAYGFELLNRIKYNKFIFIGSFTYVRSLFTDITGDYIPSSWDSRYLFTVSGTKDFKRNWSFGAKWRFVGGLPYTPYDLQTSANVQAWNAKGGPYLNYEQLNADRANAFQQLDVRVDKKYFYNKWTLMIYLDIQNLYNFQNEGKPYIIREQNAD
ncbi:MAG: TonB-dependent receptor, partial [Bacteroidales bacterium]